MIVEISLSSKKRSNQGLAIPRLAVGGLGAKYEVRLNLKKFVRLEAPDSIALDFAYIAGVVYSIDRVVPRKTAADNWTRTIEVELPVANPSVWESAKKELQQALSFLSGDVWTLSFRASNVPLFKSPSGTQKFHWSDFIQAPVTSVCLFSGGLDSFVGAVNLLDKGQRLILVGHHDSGGPQSQQMRLFQHLKPVYDAVHWVHGRVGPSPLGAPEGTLRTRSLVFLSLGILAARAIGSDIPVYAPENGVIALNPPLTPSRMGSCSTRTMHPFFLENVIAALNRVGIGNKIVNPLEFKTKGEVLTDCANAGLLKLAMGDAVSCSHSSRRQDWTRKSAANCGYCIPCLFRRAASNACGLDDGKKYGIDVCNGEITVNDKTRASEDLRALVDFVAKSRSTEEIRDLLLSVSNLTELDKRIKLVQRGTHEVRAWIAAAGNSTLKKAAALASSN